MTQNSGGAARDYTRARRLDGWSATHLDHRGGGGAHGAGGAHCPGGGGGGSALATPAPRRLAVNPSPVTKMAAPKNLGRRVIELDILLPSLMNHTVLQRLYCTHLCGERQ